MMPVWWTLWACNPGQVARVEAVTQRQEGQTAALRKEIEALRKEVDRSQAYWSLRDPVHIPADFDPTAPLPPGGTRPDVLLLSIDTLRADHLGSYGYERPTSPFMDNLAASGTRYASFWSPSPWTLPSHATMLSGQLPDRHGAFEDHTQLPADLPLLQETFAAGGYRTAGVVSTLFVSKKFGFQRGFDFFEDFAIRDKAANNRGTVDAEEIFATARHWAQRQPANTPLFLFLHSYDVHYTYNAPEPFNTAFDRGAELTDARYRNYFAYLKQPLPDAQMAHQIAQYDEEIRYVDAQLQALVEHWRASGRELVIAITSDHGEEFGERGSWGHAHTLYPEQLHVPLIVSGPGVATQVITERGGSEDLPATLAAVAGLSHPPGDGRNRARQLRSGGNVGESGLYAETSRFETSRVRIHHRGHDLLVDLIAEREELYDLRSDPNATRPLHDAQTSDVLRAKLSKRFGTPWKPSAPGTPKTLGQARIWRDGIEDGPQAAPFAVFPTDGRFTWDGAGPYDARRGLLPDANSTISYEGPTWRSEAIQLSSEETRMLEELGYIQD